MRSISKEKIVGMLRFVEEQEVVSKRWHNLFFLRFTVLLYFLLLMMLFSDSFGKTLLSSTCSGL